MRAQRGTYEFPWEKEIEEICENFSGERRVVNMRDLVSRLGSVAKGQSNEREKRYLYGGNISRLRRNLIPWKLPEIQKNDPVKSPGNSGEGAWTGHPMYSDLCLHSITDRSNCRDPHLWPGPVSGNYIGFWKPLPRIQLPCTALMWRGEFSNALT